MDQHRCNYVIPGTTSMVEMPINGGQYQQTIASLWISAEIMRNLVSALKPRQHCKMLSTAGMTVARFYIITADLHLVVNIPLRPVMTAHIGSAELSNPHQRPNQFGMIFSVPAFSHHLHLSSLSPLARTCL